MPTEFTLIAPQDIKIGDTTYHIVPPPIVQPGPVESANGTRVTATSLARVIRDAALNEWSIMAGQVSYNSTPVPSNGVVEIVYSDHKVYQKNVESAWYGPCTPTSGGSAIPGDPTLPLGSRKHTDIPFTSESVWNKGIGSNAQWSGDGDADTQKLRQLRGGVAAGVWGMPWFFGKASDPLVTVVLKDNLFPLPPQRIHVPRNAKPALGSGGFEDAHMNFFDETQPGKMWSFWGCTLNNGNDVTGGITAGLGGLFDAYSDGVSTDLGNNHNNYAAGTITDYDLRQSEIKHMIRCAMSVDATKSPGGDWMTNIPWPNTHEDWYGYERYTGPIVAGCTIGIPRSVNITSLGLSTGGLVLARCLQTYGSQWRDSTGTNQINFYATPENEGNPLIQGMRNDMGKIVPQLRVMRNQAQWSKATNDPKEARHQVGPTNGGGTYPAPLPPVG